MSLVATRPVRSAPPETDLGDTAPVPASFAPAPLIRHKATSLEHDQPLSRSVLWKLMRDFYDLEGPEAWRASDPVPHYVTSSPFLVDAYARIIEGFLHDCQALDPAPADASTPGLDRSQPVYIVELGAGHGRLGYRLVKRLARALASPAAGAVRWVYVMSDLSEHNLASWRSQPRLRPFVESGCLDFARFDIGLDQTLELAHSGVVLSPETLRNPLVVIANYIFDSLPQDAFYINRGQLYERRISLSTPEREPDIADPAIVDRVQMTCTHQPIDPDYYDNPAWNRILADYRDRLPEAAVLLPLAALECVQTFERLSAGRMLLLSGDKGWVREASFPGAPDPLDLVVHAGRCFSMMVNFHAIGQYVGQRGGWALHPRRDPRSLVVSAFLLGHHPVAYPETRQAFAEAVDAFGPDDFYTLMRAASDVWATLTPQELLAYLQLGRGDDVVLASSLPALLELLPSLSCQQRQQLYCIVRDTWDAYLPIGEKADVAFAYGTVLYELGYYGEALEFFHESASLHGLGPSTLYNIGACEMALGHGDRALRAVCQALEQDPGLDEARALRLAIESDAEGPAPGHRRSAD
jgi:tetratricopeptide (TPR) repeat protein